MTIGEEVWLLERRYVNGFVSTVAPPLCVSSRAKNIPTSVGKHVNIHLKPIGHIQSARFC